MFCFNAIYGGPKNRTRHFVGRDDDTANTHTLHYFSLYQSQRSAVIRYVAHEPSVIGGGKSN